MSSLWTYEQESWAQGCETVCGVDEAGAGPLMGPVYAAAVILPRECVIDGLSLKPDVALIDGNRDHGKHAAITTPHRCIVGGDAHAASIAAASILAKVSRDRYVIDVLDKQYPEYQFARHKGYGTKLHYEMLDKFGPCAEHRMSFLKKWSAGGRT